MDGEWNKCLEVEMPLDRQFLIYFRDEIGLCEWDDEDCVFYFVSEPAISLGILHLNKRMLEKVTHWRDLPYYPEVKI